MTRTRCEPGSPARVLRWKVARRQEEAGIRLVNALDELPDHDSPEAVALMTQLAVNQFWRTQFAAMHEAAERAVNAARRLGDAGLTAAALARLALAASMMGAAERADAHSEAVALFESLSDDELARSIDAGALLSGMELYLDRYADGDAHATRTLGVARYRSGGAFPGPDPDPGRGVAPARQAGRGGRAARRDRSGAPAGQHPRPRVEPVRPFLRRAPDGEMELALAAAQESVDLSQDLSEGFHTAEAAADLAAALLETGQPERAVELPLGSAGGEELVLIAESEGSLPRGARAQLARAGPPRRGKTCRGVRRRLGLGRSAPDGCRLGRSSGGGRRSARRRPRRAAEQALTSAAAADQVGAPVEAALAHARGSRAGPGRSERSCSRRARAGGR